MDISPRWKALSPKDRMAYTFIRACRDSRFKMPYVQAAQLTGRILSIDPLIVGFELGFDVMERIADGTHPCLKNPKYADVYIEPEPAAMSTPEPAQMPPTTPQADRGA